MTPNLQFILSLSISLTVIIGVVRFKNIDKAYYPFIYLSFVSLIVELLSTYFSKQRNYEIVTVVINIFDFIEFFLLTWLYHNWGLFNFDKKIFILISSSIFLSWVVLTFFVEGIKSPSLYFTAIYCTTLLIFTVTVFNKFVIPDRKELHKNPMFWIVCGNIIFFLFYLLIQSANISLFNETKDLRKNLYRIVIYTNFIVNLMYAVGAICIPKKKNIINLF